MQAGGSRFPIDLDLYQPIALFRVADRPASPPFGTAARVPAQAAGACGGLRLAIETQVRAWGLWAFKGRLDIHRAGHVGPGVCGITPWRTCIPRGACLMYLNWKCHKALDSGVLIFGVVYVSSVILGQLWDGSPSQCHAWQQVKGVRSRVFIRRFRFVS